MKQECKILSTTAILGYGYPEESFYRGLDNNPDLIAVDAGSTDPGPYYLGSGKSFTNRSFVKRDLLFMIKEGVKRKIPVVIGTAGGSGAKPHLDWCKKIILEIAEEEKLSFTMGLISADIPHKLVEEACVEKKLSPLPFVPEVTLTEIKETSNIVAQMGYEPIIKALKKGCDVVLAGRCYDPAVFAALPIMKGFNPGLALHMGKILECAAIAATPGSGSDCVMGTLTKDSFILEPLSSERKFTKESTAAHTLYEKSDPYRLPGPGGIINLEKCSFKNLTQGRVEVKGSEFIPSEKYMIKLEGARKIGNRAISIAGSRDPIMIKGIDSILAEVRKRLETMIEIPAHEYELHFHVYGKNGIMGPMEPHPNAAHELCIVIEAIAKDQKEADQICSITRSTLLHYGYKNRISTAGNLAFPFSPSDISMGDVYVFSLYHLIEADPLKLFPIKIVKVGGKK